jgi:hypothetical protein
MPDYSMCLDNRCSVKEYCSRHADSGTRPSKYQAYSEFAANQEILNDPVNKCPGYIKRYRTYRGKCNG